MEVRRDTNTRTQPSKQAGQQAESNRQTAKSCCCGETKGLLKQTHIHEYGTIAIKIINIHIYNRDVNTCNRYSYF